MATTYQSPSLYIDGKDIASTKYGAIDVLNPATEEVLGSAPTAGAEEIAAALAAAERGLITWSKVSAWERSNILRKTGALMRERVDHIGMLLTLEVGKTLAESKGEVAVSADHLDWSADETRRLYDTSLPGRTAASRFETSYEPVGVVLGLNAWNAPISLASRKISLSLAAGCSIILRPAEEAPACVAALVQCFRDAGVPPGVINLIYGPAEAVVAPLMKAHSVRMCSFTGSTRVGQILIKQSADTLKRVHMELGGHAPVMVYEDADITKLAAAAAAGKTRSSGQVCTSPSRFFVHHKVHDEFAEKFVKAISAIKVGNGMDASSQMGPLATSRQRDRIERLVADARKKGATVATGGERPSDMNRGYFYRPTVLTNVPENADVLTEEPFCPLAAVIKVDDMDSAMVRANALEAGLAAYVWTKDMQRAENTCRQLQAGVIAVNNFQVATAEGPFGGIKAGGFGREGGHEGVRDFLNMKFKHKMVV